MTVDPMPDARPAPRRVRWQGMALLLLAFVTGTLAGAAGHHFLRSPSFGGPGGRGGMRGPAGMLRELDLTPDQCARIRAIFAQHHPQMQVLLSETMPRMRAIADSMQTEVRAVLTPEQRAKLEKRMPRGERGHGRIFGGGEGAAAGPGAPPPGPGGMAGRMAEPPDPCPAR